MITLWTYLTNDVKCALFMRGAAVIIGVQGGGLSKPI